MVQNVDSRGGGCWYGSATSNIEGAVPKKSMGIVSRFLNLARLVMCFYY